MKNRSTPRRLAGPAGILAVLVVAAGLGLPATARADVPVTTLTTVPARVRGLVVARGHDGSTTAAWIDGGAVSVATRRAGGAWGEPDDVASYGADGDTVWPSSLGLVTAGDGSALLSWQVLNSEGSGEVDVALRDVDGTWSAPSVLQTTSGEPADPTAGVAADGTFVVAAFSDQGVRVSTRPPGGSWAESTVPRSAAALTGEETHPGLAVAPDGTVTVLWTSGHPYAARRRPGGPWSRPVDLGGTTIALSRGVLDVGEDGTVAAAWPDTGPAEGMQYRIRVALHRPGHHWVTGYRTGRRDKAFVTGIAVGPRGTTTLLWDVDIRPGAHRLRMATHRPGHHWSRPVTIGPVFRIGPNASVAVDRRGRRLLTVAGVRRGERVGSVWVRWSTRRGWTKPVRVTHAPTVNRPVVAAPALGDHGVATLLWYRWVKDSDGPDHRIETADVHRP